MKLLNKKQAIENFDECGSDWFMSALIDEYNFTTIGGNSDYRDEGLILDKKDYTRITGIKPVNLHYYQSSHCGHEFDCCGCVSSVSIDVVNNRNGYVTVFIHTSFNY